MTEASKRPEAVAARGARWFTVALVIVGVLNYGYSLILTRLLNVGAYAGFAAAQSLILWATTLATVSVPWVLAQGLARARSDEERGAAVRFAKLASAGSGFVGAIVVGLIATRFGGLGMALTAGLSTFVIFLGTATTGWLQGQQRMGALSGLLVCENVVKNLAGLVLVLVVGLRGIGAIAAFGIGGVVILLRWPRAPAGRGGAWRAAMANRRLWRRTVIMASVQGMVSLFIVLERGPGGTATRRPRPGGQLSGQRVCVPGPDVHRGRGGDGVLPVTFAENARGDDRRTCPPDVYGSGVAGRRGADDDAAVPSHTRVSSAIRCDGDAVEVHGRGRALRRRH